MFFWSAVFLFGAAIGFNLYPVAIGVIATALYTVIFRVWSGLGDYPFITRFMIFWPSGNNTPDHPPSLLG